VEVHPLQEKGASVEIKAVIAEVQKRGLRYPMLLRFQDIVRHRVAAINGAFKESIDRHNYSARYRGVFPVKVNQLREVVEEIVDAGKKFDFGLEVGSRPELFAALAMMDDPGSLIVCNGYKDEGFIRVALMGNQLGKQVVLVVEKLEELPTIIRLARETGVEPSSLYPLQTIKLPGSSIIAKAAKSSGRLPTSNPKSNFFPASTISSTTSRN
jgi:arginine decarboxylase